MKASRMIALLGAASLIGTLLALYVAHQEPAPKIQPAPAAFTVSQGRAYFVENRHAGKLYVIEGEVTNNLAEPRCLIAIKASLLDDGGGLVAQEFPVAGLTATVSGLKFLDWEELRASLVPPGADPCGATRLAPGQAARFMAVFRDPPDKAASFSLSVAGSQ